MTMMFVAFVFSSACGPVDPGLFGDFNRRNAAAVSAELDSIAGLPTETFDELAPSVVTIIRSAKSIALAVHALDVLCAKAGRDRAGEFIWYLGDSLEHIDAQSRVRTTLLVGAFLTIDLSKLGPGMRASPTTVAFVTSVVHAPAGPLDPGYYDKAVDTLVELLPPGADPRPILVDLVQRGSLGAPRAAERLRTTADAAIVGQLRQMAAPPAFKRYVIEVLANIGDEACTPVLLAQRAAAEVSTNRERVEFLDNAVRRIQLQHPPSNLIGCIRSPNGDGAIQYWAISRAVELNLARTDIRAAILGWASSASPYYLGSVRDYARNLNVLDAGDLSDAAPSLTRGFGCPGQVERRVGTVDVPDRRPNSDRWRPNMANYDAFFGWYRGQNRQTWRALPEAERVRRIRLRLCQLDFLSPEACEQGASSQPSPP